MNRNVGIIGAGLGGLSAAIHLARRGKNVTVYESNSTPGGKASEVRMDGFRFDTGPSLITMPFVIEQLYDVAGTPANERIQLIPVDPICRYFYPDGTVLDACASEEEFRTQVRTLAPSDAEAVTRFLDYSQRIYELTSDIFLFHSLSDLKSLLRWKNLPTLLRLPQIDAFHTVHERVQSYFRDPRLVQLFDRYATYNGSNPFTAPATLNIIPYVEYRLGASYVHGGIYALVRSLESAARSLGVSFRYDTPVEGIVVEGGRVRGVRTADGTCAHDAVVSNADAVHTMTTLLGGAGSDAVKRARRYGKLEPSCSGLVFLWGVRGRNDSLAHHNIVFSDNYAEEFDAIFTRRVAPSDPTVYVSITSRADPEHAPEGHENWFVLVNMPALTDANRDTDIGSVRTAVLRRLHAAGFDIAGDIVCEETITPSDLERRYNANKGSIYGISSNSRNAAFLRPRNRIGSPEGLYLCGGSAHPGGGVPLVLLSGKLAAEAVA
ncbi:MAG: phytoene desaturase [Bacteroidetes bacterium]|nr:phytoene desaturase [Bacteroidota bacterium]